MHRQSVHHPHDTIMGTHQQDRIPGRRLENPSGLPRHGQNVREERLPEHLRRRGLHRPRATCGPQQRCRHKLCGLPHQGQRAQRKPRRLDQEVEVSPSRRMDQRGHFYMETSPQRKCRPPGRRQPSQCPQRQGESKKHHDSSQDCHQSTIQPALELHKIPRP